MHRKDGGVSDARVLSLARGTAVWLTAALMLPCAARAQVPGLYRIDTHSSHVEIHVFRGGFLSGLGDNHLIALGKFTGTASRDPASGWKVDVRAESASLEVLDPGLSPSTRQEIQTTMRGPTQLDVEHYPSIELRSKTVTTDPGGRSGTLRAELALHGVTKEVEFPLSWTEQGGKLRVTGKKTLRLRDFGIEPISRGLGAVKVRNEFEVVYDIALEHEATSGASRIGTNNRVAALRAVSSARQARSMLSERRTSE